jgi:hypothetical protein
MSISNGGSSFFRIRKALGLVKQQSKFGDKWLRTDDVYGHSPTFPINCGHCSEKMMLRYTEIMPSRGRSYRINEGVNNMAYKCPRCHVMYKFFVPDDTEYLLKILEKHRDGFGLYLPPVDEWKKENKEIKKRLQDLNYM